MRLRWSATLCVAAIAASGAAAIPLVRKSGPAEARPLAGMTVAQSLARMRQSFTENRGQTDPRVRFYTSTPGGSVFVTGNGALVYAVSPAPDRASRGATLSEELVGATVREVGGQDRSPTLVNVFHGNDPAKWHRNVATYETVSLGEVYPGIDVRFHAVGASVEKIFTVQPGSDPHQVRLRVTGGRSLAVTPAGELEVETTAGPVRFSRPLASVDVAYVVEADQYAFRLGAYDRGQALVIDPHLVSTYLGGSADDSAHAVMPDGAGSVYVAGATSSFDFPGIGTTSPDSVLLGCNFFAEAFVAKLDAGLTTLQAVTYLGGSSLVPEFATSLTMNAAGEIYVAGVTGSSDFPGISTSSSDPVVAGTEGFVVRLDHDLTAILSATFVGGSLFDRVQSVGYDGVTNLIYAAGGTHSPEMIGPAAPDPLFQGGAEAFVVALPASLQFSFAGGTFLGGSASTFHEIAEDLAFDAAGNVYVTGTTDSADFPQISGADTNFGAPTEAFVVKLAPALTSILGATFLGAVLEDEGKAIARLDDTLGSWIYVAGSKRNTGGFPGISPTSAQFVVNGSHTRFVSRLDAGLSTVVSSYVGSGSILTDIATAHDPGGSVYVTGYGSGNSPMPGIDGSAADSTTAGLEGFVVRLNPGLTAFLGGTFLGGGGSEQLLAVAVDSATGYVYAAGLTSSFDFPGVGLSAPDHSLVPRDAFVTRLRADLKALWVIIMNAFKELLFSLSSRADLSPLPELVDRAEKLGLRGNFQAAIQQTEHFIRWTERLSNRLSADERRQLVGLAEELIAEFEHMDERGEVDRPPRQPRDLLPVCPTSPPPGRE